MTTHHTTAPGSPRRRADAERSIARILDAAVDCLVEEGYAGASTLAVQARAGISRGRLLHHFPSRAELLVAACDHLVTTQLEEVRRRSVALMADGPTGRERVDRAIDLMKGWVEKARRPEMIGGLGGFAGLFDASALTRYERPLREIFG